MFREDVIGICVWLWLYCVWRLRHKQACIVLLVDRFSITHTLRGNMIMLFYGIIILFGCVSRIQTNPCTYKASGTSFSWSGLLTNVGCNISSSTTSTVTASLLRSSFPKYDPTWCPGLLCPLSRTLRNPRLWNAAQNRCAPYHFTSDQNVMTYIKRYLIPLRFLHVSNSDIYCAYLHVLPYAILSRSQTFRMLCSPCPVLISSCTEHRLPLLQHCPPPNLLHFLLVI